MDVVIERDELDLGSASVDLHRVRSAGRGWRARVLHPASEQDGDEKPAE
jgi:hypothetical protein